MVHRYFDIGMYLIDYRDHIFRRGCMVHRYFDIGMYLIDYREHDSFVPKPNHECNICDYTFSIKEVLAIHMHKEHNGAASVQRLCDMCSFTSHLSCVLHRKHLGILKTFECNKCYFSAKRKGVQLKHHEHLRHKRSHPNM